MPSKLTGMLSSGRPIVATAVLCTQLAEVVSGCGFAVEPGNPNALAGAIKALVGDAVLRMKLGVSARQYAEAHLDRNRVLERFENDLQICLLA
jgi:colanic acid biosynthesis glycosyl transferase WcaI